MPYATKEDLQVRLGPDTLLRLTDDNQDGSPDDEIINSVISQASSLIDAILAIRYKTPLVSPPEAITFFCLSLAIPLLFARRNEKIPEEHYEFKRHADRWLEDIRSGTKGFGNLASQLLPQSTTLGKSKHFGADQMKEC